MTQPSLTIRMAQEQDVPLILRFIRELAQYEGLLDQVTATQEVLEEWLFRRKKAEVVFPMVRGRRLGLPSFSTISPPFWGERACIWRTCTSSRSTGAGDTAGR